MIDDVELAGTRAPFVNTSTTNTYQAVSVQPLCSLCLCGE